MSTDKIGNNPMDVSETLNKYKQQFLPVSVDKIDDLYYDLGNLVCIDSHPLDLEQLKNGNPEEYLKEVSQRDTNGVFANLPDSNMRIPREKPIPKPKQDTAWEKFAKIKGIEKKKRSKMIFDEQTKEWKPRWGYKRGNTDQHDWLIEHKPSETGDFEDPFLKRKVDKRNRIRDQTKREGKNKYRAAKQGSTQYDKFLSGGLSEGSKRRLATKDLLQEDLNKSRSATASLGKFDKKLQNEKAPNRGKQKKRAVVTSKGINDEKTKNISIVDRMLSKTEGNLNTNKAAKRGRATAFASENEFKRKKR